MICCWLSGLASGFVGRHLVVSMLAAVAVPPPSAAAGDARCGAGAGDAGVCDGLLDAN